MDTSNSKDGIDFQIYCFESVDIEKYLDQIINMQLENIYKFHYPEKKINKNFVETKIKELKNHLSNGNTHFIGAISEDRLYGFIWGYESIFIDEKRMTVNSLFVDKEARGTGLGSQLMNKIKKIAIDSGCNSIATHYSSFNTAAGKFYSQNEFSQNRIEMVCNLK